MHRGKRNAGVDALGSLREGQGEPARRAPKRLNAVARASALGSFLLRALRRQPDFLGARRQRGEGDAIGEHDPPRGVAPALAGVIAAVAPA
jgi:hypothetical protein